MMKSFFQFFSILFSKIKLLINAFAIFVPFLKSDSIVYWYTSDSKRIKIKDIIGYKLIGISRNHIFDLIEVFLPYYFCIALYCDF